MLTSEGLFAAIPGPLLPTSAQDNGEEIRYLQKESQKILCVEHSVHTHYDTLERLMAQLLPFS